MRRIGLQCTLQSYSKVTHCKQNSNKKRKYPDLCRTSERLSIPFSLNRNTVYPCMWLQVLSLQLNIRIYLFLGAPPTTTPTVLGMIIKIYIVYTIKYRILCSVWRLPHRTTFWQLKWVEWLKSWLELLVWSAVSSHYPARNSAREVPHYSIPLAFLAFLPFPSFPFNFPFSGPLSF